MYADIFANPPTSSCRPFWCTVATIPFSLCCALYKTCSLQTAPRPRRREGLAPRRGEGRPAWVKIGLQCWSAAWRQAVSFSLRVCASRLRPPRGVLPPADKVSARPSDPPGMCVFLAACSTQLRQAYDIPSKRPKAVLGLVIGDLASRRSQTCL